MSARALSKRRGRCTNPPSWTRGLRGGCWVRSGADRLSIGLWGASTMPRVPPCATLSRPWPKRLHNGLIRLEPGTTDQVDAVGHGGEHGGEVFLDGLGPAGKIDD